MLLTQTGASIRLLALAVVLVLALGVTACGGSDDDGGGDAAAKPGEVAKGGGQAGATSDEAQIKAMFKRLEGALSDGDADRFCGGLTKSGRKESLQFTLPFSKTCKDSVRKMTKVNRNANLKQVPAKILGVKVNGDRAKITISDGGRPPVALAAARQGGEWKLASIGVGVSTAD